jgi:hypothetical protein
MPQAVIGEVQPPPPKAVIPSQLHHVFPGHHRCHATAVTFSFMRRPHWNSSRSGPTSNPIPRRITPTQLAELASEAKPRLLIIYHASIVLRPALRPQASPPKSFLRGCSRAIAEKWSSGEILTSTKKMNGLKHFSDRGDSLPPERPKSTWRKSPECPSPIAGDYIH